MRRKKNIECKTELKYKVTSRKHNRAYTVNMRDLEKTRIKGCFLEIGRGPRDTALKG